VTDAIRAEPLAFHARLIATKNANTVKNATTWAAALNNLTRRRIVANWAWFVVLASDYPNKWIWQTPVTLNTDDSS